MRYDIIYVIRRQRVKIHGDEFHILYASVRNSGDEVTEDEMDV